MLSRIPPITRALLLINIAVFVLQIFLHDAMRPLQLWPIAWGMDDPPLAPAFWPWQLVTHAFMHGDPVHLILNMVALVMFGTQLEYHFGQRRYLIFCAVCGIGTGVLQVALNTAVLHIAGQAATVLGFSAVTFGLLVGYGLSFPNQRVGMLFLPIMMRARTLVLIMVGVQVAYAIFSAYGGYSALGHLFGAGLGWAMLRWWQRKPPSPPPPPRRKRPSHLRVVR